MNNPANYLGSEEAYAKQQPDGSYLPERHGLGPHDLADHKAGKQTLGTYTNWYDKARFIVFDIDTGDLALAQHLKSECIRRGLSAGVEFSGRKGYHVWVLFQQWEPAADVRRLARHIAEGTDFTGEVFPKQEVARDLGNLVKLPFGVHQVTKQRSRFIGPEPVPVGHDGFVAVVASLPPPRIVPHRDLGSSVFPCLDPQQQGELREGERNVMLFHFACHMRRAGLGEGAIAKLLEEYGDGMDEPELDAIVRNSEFSGPVCDQLSSDRRCPDELCVKTRGTFKGTLRPGSLKHATAGQKVLVERGEVAPGATTVPLYHPDVEQARAALKREREE